MKNGTSYVNPQERETDDVEAVQVQKVPRETDWLVTVSANAVSEYRG